MSTMNICKKIGLKKDEKSQRRTLWPIETGKNVIKSKNVLSKEHAGITVLEQ